MENEKVFNRNFYLLLQGQLINQLGTFLYLIAAIFMVKSYTSSATIVGFLAVASQLPAVVFGPLGGVIVDRFSKKKLVVIGDIVNGISMITVILVVILLPDSTILIVYLIFLAAIISGVIGAFYRPAIGAWTPELVSPEKLQSANGLLLSTNQMASILGQGAGGLLFSLLGGPLVIFINGVTCFLSAISKFYIKSPKAENTHVALSSRHRITLWKEMLEGVEYIKKKPGLLDLIVVFATLNFFSAPIIVLMPFYVEDVLNSTPVWYGYLVTVFAIGVAIGGLLLGRVMINPKYKSYVLVVMLYLITGLVIVLSFLTMVYPVMIVLGFTGILIGFISTVTTSTLQQSSDIHIRGRVMGLVGTMAGALLPISLGLSGIVADMLDQNIPLIYFVSGIAIGLGSTSLIFRKGFHRLLNSNRS